MTVYIGIDPGFSGAWAAIDHNAEYVGCGDLHHDKDMIHTDLVWSEILDAIRGRDYEIIIEAVHSMPGQGVSSTFKFGKAYGQVIGMAHLANCPVHFVSPQRWKKDSGLSSDKEESLNMARKLWPAAPLGRKKDNGRAEAMLIAAWHLEQL